MICSSGNPDTIAEDDRTIRDLNRNILEKFSYWVIGQKWGKNWLVTKRCYYDFIARHICLPNEVCNELHLNNFYCC